MLTKKKKKINEKCGFGWVLWTLWNRKLCLSVFFTSLGFLGMGRVRIGGYTRWLGCG